MMVGGCVREVRPEMKLTHVSYLGDWGWVLESKKANRGGSRGRLLGSSILGRVWLLLLCFYLVM